MREIALHILDLLENSIRARATTVRLAVSIDPQRDRLDILIEDDGTGLAVSPDEASDPFYTTKAGKRTGLGLSLFRHAAELAGGGLTIEPSASGGVRVHGSMQLRHVDRLPLGDLPATLSAVVMANPGLDVRFSLQVAGEELGFSELEPAAVGERNGRSVFSLARQVAELTRAGLDRAEALIGMAL